MAAPSEDAIFDVARQISSQAARGAYLDQACDGDAELRARLDDLLAAHDAADSHLDIPPLAATTARTAGLKCESEGDFIGPYKLLQRLGEGGMGVVYLAEQKEPVKRRVALKIIKPGMDIFEFDRLAWVVCQLPGMQNGFHSM
jgi:serine/threonine-protein kinase